ncbi:Hypothetical_protein [Hexamita inflata]|uniref:Hypothetical_protein n=1 Tax=Hexamita inflata TaxID=28002 RepID=A0AA86PAV4_9EUKA|nr:Hypothetical protein HINF_LOCUS21956 [Hexamita inflata]
MTSSISTYVSDVYKSLLGAINGIATAQDPCNQWPGSVNHGGLCKCKYGDESDQYQQVFCPNWNMCCRFAGIAATTYIYRCVGNTYQMSEGQPCPGHRMYANDGYGG